MENAILGFGDMGWALSSPCLGMGVGRGLGGPALWTSPVTHSSCLAGSPGLGAPWDNLCCVHTTVRKALCRPWGRQAPSIPACKPTNRASPLNVNRMFAMSL